MKSNRSTIVLSLLAVILVALPFILPAVHLNASLGTTILLFALAAASVNIMLGYTGMMAFGNAAFFGVGAYGSAIFAARFMPNLLIAIAFGSILGMLSAVLIGPFLIRRRGIYFSLLSIAFGQVYYFIAYRWNDVTAGEDGLSTQRPPMLGHPLNDSEYYYLSLVVFALMMLLLWYIVRSPFGLTLRAISQNEVRARYLGINSDRFIFLSLALSGFYAGVAGALYSMSINFSYPLLLDWHQSGDFVMMVVLGGAGTLWGPLLGATIYALGSNVLSTVTETWQILIGAIFVACILFFPRGILGIAAFRTKSRTRAPQAIDDDDGAAVAHAMPAYEPVAEGKH